MANAFVEELRNLTKTLAISEAAQRRLFFEQQLSLTKDNLTKSQMTLQASGVSEATLRTVPQSALEALARLKAQITAQEIKLASMRTFMTESNPEFRLGVQELTALRAEFAKAEQTTQVSSSGNGVEYIAKYRDFKYHEALFELMAKQYEMARLDEARDGAVIQVVDAAQPPERKSKPRRAFIAVLATLGALIGALLLVLSRHSLKRLAAHPQASGKLERLRQQFGLHRR
jgi:uncharacterized protein involved in exopolysaccharide biosynthesis